MSEAALDMLLELRGELYEERQNALKLANDLEGDEGYYEGIADSCLETIRRIDRILEQV